MKLKLSLKLYLFCRYFQFHTTKIYFAVLYISSLVVLLQKKVNNFSLTVIRHANVGERRRKLFKLTQQFKRLLLEVKEKFTNHHPVGLVILDLSRRKQTMSQTKTYIFWRAKWIMMHSSWKTLESSDKETRWTEKVIYSRKMIKSSGFCWCMLCDYIEYSNLIRIKTYRKKGCLFFTISSTCQVNILLVLINWIK